MTSDDGVCIQTVESPVGLLTVVASSKGLRRLSFFPQRPPGAPRIKRHAVIQQTVAELGEYFEGCRRQFSVPLDLRGTPFQKSVWELLLKIPYGETRSYGALARQLGGVGKSRAVGLANGANPLAIIVPCHPRNRGGGRFDGLRRWTRKEILAASARKKKRARRHRSFRLYETLSHRITSLKVAFLPYIKTPTR